MTTAERLIAAADLLEGRAREATAGPWAPHYASDLHSDAAAWIGAPGQATKDGVFVATTANAVEGLGDAFYIATMHPEVGTALAAWLRFASSRLERMGAHWQAMADDRREQFNANAGHALNLADLLLAGA